MQIYWLLKQMIVYTYLPLGFKGLNEHQMRNFSIFRFNFSVHNIIHLVELQADTQVGFR
jgi:hypothetical protein